MKRFGIRKTEQGVELADCYAHAAKKDFFQRNAGYEQYETRAEVKAAFEAAVKALEGNVRYGYRVDGREGVFVLATTAQELPDAYEEADCFRMAYNIAEVERGAAEADAMHKAGIF